MNPTPPALSAHLRAWVGAWPPPSAAIHVVGTPARHQPAWDGRVRVLHGAVDDEGGAVVTVPPELHRPVAELLHGRPVDVLDDPRVARQVADVVAGRDSVLGVGVLRWATSVPEDVEPVGQWLPVDDPRIPGWLLPFGGQVLVVLGDDDSYVAGAGIKRHGPTGWEVAVGTEPEHRGRGLARRLTVTATRHALEHVPVVTYLHDPTNAPSARVADAAGFPDRGWRVVGVFGGER